MALYRALIGCNQNQQFYFQSDDNKSIDEQLEKIVADLGYTTNSIRQERIMVKVELVTPDEKGVLTYSPVGWTRQIMPPFKEMSGSDFDNERTKLIKKIPYQFYDSVFAISDKITDSSHTFEDRLKSLQIVISILSPAIDWYKIRKC